MRKDELAAYEQRKAWEAANPLPAGWCKVAGTRMEDAFYEFIKEICDVEGTGFACSLAVLSVNTLKDLNDAENSVLEEAGLSGEQISEVREKLPGRL